MGSRVRFHRSAAAITMGLLLATVGVSSSVASAEAPPRPAYRQALLPVDARIDDLLARMTLEEKVAQLQGVWQKKNLIQDAGGAFSAAVAKKTFPNGIGQVSRPGDRVGSAAADGKPVAAGAVADVANRDGREAAAYANAAQRWAVQDTRLGIPLLFHEEALDGFVARRATSFPQAIALASSWDPALVERVFSVAAREMRVRGVQLALSPVLDVARDPRWGRSEETYGEDPHLVAEIGLAAIRGLQGETLPLADNKVFATLKHLAGHGQPENGINVGPAPFSERMLRENFLPPFKRALLGSIDANRGNPQNGWDTDQFPVDLYDTVGAMLVVLRQGGLAPGGLNFDAKLRRESVDMEDLFIAHIGGMDAFARGLEVAHALLQDSPLEDWRKQRYASFSDGEGHAFASGTSSLLDLCQHAANAGEPTPRSGRQEAYENLLNQYLIR